MLTCLLVKSLGIWRWPWEGSSNNTSRSSSSRHCPWKWVSGFWKVQSSSLIRWASVPVHWLSTSVLFALSVHDYNYLYRDSRKTFSVWSLRIYLFFFHFVFVLGPCPAMLVITLYSGIITGRLKGWYGILKIKSGSATCKHPTNSTISLAPKKPIFLSLSRNRGWWTLEPAWPSGRLSGIAIRGTVVFFVPKSPVGRMA